MNKLLLLYVAEWLTSPGGTKCSKPIEEVSKDDLNVCLTSLYTSSRKKDGTDYISSSMKFLKEQSLIVSFARRRTTNLDDTEFL